MSVQTSMLYVGALTNPAVACPAGKVGKAIRGRRGSYIDSLRYVCDDYNK
jgi:hypothetical protein